jgi:hypothetical protein
MILLSDFLIPEGYQQGLNTLAGAAGGFDVYCLQILSPGELDPTREGTAPGAAPLIGDLRLTDVETGRGAEITITADLINQYKATVAAYIQNLKQFCAARSMSHMLVQSDTDVESLVLDHLRRRGLLR